MSLFLWSLSWKSLFCFCFSFTSIDLGNFMSVWLLTKMSKKVLNLDRLTFSPFVVCLSSILKCFYLLQSTYWSKHFQVQNWITVVKWKCCLCANNLFCDIVEGTLKSVHFPAIFKTGSYGNRPSSIFSASLWSFTIFFLFCTNNDKFWGLSTCSRWPKLLLVS